MKTITFIAALFIIALAGCTKQTATVIKPFPSILYYRVQEEDLDGNLTYSKVVVVGNTKQTTAVTDDDGGRNCKTADPHSNWYLEHCTVAPVIFVSLSAQVEQRIVVLDWSTGVESNVKTFIVQRSEDGSIYEDAGFLAPKGISGTGASYEFWDKSFR